MLRDDITWTHIWRDGFTEWKPLSQLRGVLYPGVTNVFIWLYALAPLLLLLFPLVGTPSWWPSWGFYGLGALFIVPEWIDQTFLKRAGLNSPAGWKGFVPQYAYYRAKLVGDDLSYF